MKKIILLPLLILNLSFAQLSLDRTRVILDHKAGNSVSVVVKNTNPTTPYLAQAWVEDDHGNKIHDALVALPILQRLNALQEKQIKISLLAGAANLAQDRETLLFFNVLGVPRRMDRVRGN